MTNECIYALTYHLLFSCTFGCLFSLWLKIRIYYTGAHMLAEFPINTKTPFSIIQCNSAAPKTTVSKMTTKLNQLLCDNVNKK